MPNKRTPQTPHPLHEVVLQAFSDREVHDATSLATFLAGATSLSGTKGKGGMVAYRTVAQDVLEYMEGQGHLFLDQVGWYHMSSKVAK